jgi:FdhD protein
MRSTSSQAHWRAPGFPQRPALSIELVQKAAAIGCPIIVAVSAPTALALRAAEDCGMTVIAIARDDSLEIFTHGERIAI